ncbi:MULTISPECIES: uracil-DNA glycosylase [Leuconostoc]|uniref:Uracil-DNA glycosylase n=2 Tax=Leuconostoc kimchii TaxID=136609 RepID=D5T131_LEUKI|nr:MULTISPECIES: uracil-DNA glycosylase [Leuconostoc]ADG39980.1 uracil-DNA glycosylase [Leuconostoc kimchii IMSNU 11154]AEJ30220.1 uracil-DNA glycosylase [Leuconostoc sp. C2]QBR47304.1 uracil-DNA glycosylase [Leuconostoc kimchii]
MPLSHTSWAPNVKKKLTSDQIENISAFLARVYQNAVVFPPKDKVFAALVATTLQNTKVVIMGQDPYHELGQAQGLSFSVPDVVPAPPSLRNILTELTDDVGTRSSHDLTSWTTQGVLLLNAVLTVPEGRANAHAKGVWEPLTDAIIQIASEDDQPKVFILWGKYAQSKRQLIDETRHLVIASAHPSPLSAYRGFFGSRPFSKANAFLIKNSREPIKWLE